MLLWMLLKCAFIFYQTILRPNNSQRAKFEWPSLFNSSLCALFKKPEITSYKVTGVPLSRTFKFLNLAPNYLYWRSTNFLAIAASMHNSTDLGHYKKSGISILEANKPKLLFSQFILGRFVYILVSRPSLC